MLREGSDGEVEDCGGSGGGGGGGDGKNKNLNCHKLSSCNTEKKTP